MKNSKGYAALAALFVSVALLFAFNPKACAQIRAQASLTGYVSDPTGAMIPEAKVRITNVGTGVSSVSATNSGGNYYFPALNAGVYKVEANAPGFKTMIQTGFQISVGEQASLDFHLPIGATTQTLTVQAQISHLQTQTGQQSGVVSGPQIQLLSVNGRNFMTMAKLVPGAAATPGNESIGHIANDINFNGGRTEDNAYFIDGAFDSDPGSKTSIQTSPALAAISQFSVVTSNYSAEYGVAGSAVVDVDIKSGTNQFHGSAYDEIRNDAFDARNFFSKTTPPLKLNDFGFTVGGPIKKNKLFFFYSQEWRRQRAGTVVSAHTPSALELAGNFSQSPLPKSGALTDPTGKGCVTGTQLNPACFDPQVLKLLGGGAFPQATTTTNGFQNFIGAPSLPTNYNQELVRADYNMTQKLQLMVHFIREGYDTIPATSQWGSQAFPTISTNFAVPSQNFLVRMTQMISPNLVNETSFSYAFDNDIGTPTGKYAAPAGFNITPLFASALNPDNRIPSLSFNQGYGGIDVAAWPLSLIAPVYSWADTFTQIHGAHTLKYGGVFQYDIKNQPAQVHTQGQFAYNGEFTGNALADFLLGYPASFSQTNVMLTGHYRYQQYEAFVEDDVKATKHLTLNLGLRYYYIPHVYDKFNQLTNFVPANWSAAQAPQLNSSGNIVAGTGNLLNGIVQAGKGINRGLVKNYWDTFGPRLGFAWDPFGHGKTVIRGGYGVTYFRVQGNDTYNIVGNPPFAVNASVNTPPFDNPAGGTAAPITPSSLLALDQNYKVPQIQQYSMGVQRLLPADSTLSVSYVGSRATHLQNELNINQPLPYQNFQFNPALNGSVPRNLYVPYAGWGSISSIQTGADSDYNSLQVDFEKQMARNLRFQVAYTYSKSMDDASGYNTQPQNPYDFNAEWSPSDYDRPQLLVMNYIYDLPFFKGQKGFKGEALGGWQMAGTTTYESGTPRNIGLTGSHDGLAGRPNLVSPITQTGTVSQWFSTSSFAYPAFGFYGNLGRNVVRGPGLGEWDMSFYKTFALGERANFQMRFEFFNIFNHTNFNAVSSSLGSGSFGQVTSAYDPRIFQIGAWLNF
ncbi:MAG: carboxypeptidase regulatory-like domain-containing protein [Terriglobia bacterium]